MYSGHGYSCQPFGYGFGGVAGRFLFRRKPFHSAKKAGIPPTEMFETNSTKEFGERLIESSAANRETTQWEYNEPNFTRFTEPLRGMHVDFLNIANAY